MADRMTKALLLTIVLGLWMNVAGQWFRPVTVQAQDDTRIVRVLNGIDTRLSNIEGDLSNIQGEVSSLASGASSIERDVSSIEDAVSRLARGTCINSKIC